MCQYIARAAMLVVIFGLTACSQLFNWGTPVRQGQSSSLQTFVDTAVFDVPTRKLLFRAPGTDVTANKATAIESNEELRKAQQEGFRRAMANMTANLRKELVTFQERVKKNESGVRVAQRNTGGAGGSGGAGVLELALLLLIVLWKVEFSRRRT